MKKMFAISLMLVFILTTAMAEVSISGLVGAGVTIVESDSTSTNDLDSGGILFGRLQATAENEDGTFGGLLRVQAGIDKNLVDSVYAWAWWRPLDMLRLQIGFIDAFAVNDIVGWEFHTNDSEDNNIASAGYGYDEYKGNRDFLLHRSTGFYNGTWWTGAALSLTPLKGLALNIAIPFGPGNRFLRGVLDSDKNTYRSYDVYRSIHAQAVYTIEGIGRAAITFRGRDDLGTDYIEGGASTLYGSFYLFAFENMGVNLGVAYTLPVKDKETNITYNAPVAAGLGLSCGFDDFSLKARFAATFAGSKEAENGNKTIDPFRLGFGINPSYNFGILKLFLNTGVSFVSEEEGVKDSYAFGWHANPYITKTVGPGTLYAGVRIESFGKNKDDTAIEWGIPIAIQFEF